jgi:AhpD family alkylhydroperoxidase
MEQRMQMAAVAPEGYRRVLALESYVRDAVEPPLFGLIKLRASVVNGCAFCVDMHGTDLLGQGEDVRRVLAVSAWRESAFFTERERIAFALTDEVTRLDPDGVSDEVWDAAVKEFGEADLANLILAIATINTWNRIAVSTHAATPPLEPANG